MGAWGRALRRSRPIAAPASTDGPDLEGQTRFVRFRNAAPTLRMRLVGPSFSKMSNERLIRYDSSCERIFNQLSRRVHLAAVLAGGRSGKSPQQAGQRPATILSDGACEAAPPVPSMDSTPAVEPRGLNSRRVQPPGLYARPVHRRVNPTAVSAMASARRDGCAAPTRPGLAR
jgi:hypothetical protein